MVKEQFAWRHYYWYLTNEGTNFLREYLNLPPEIVPATLKRPTRPEGTKTAKRGIETEISATIIIDVSSGYCSSIITICRS